MSDLGAVVDEILKDYKAIALEAAKEAAHKGQDDAMEEAKKAVSEETERIRKVALSRETEAIHAIIDGLY